MKSLLVGNHSAAKVVRVQAAVEFVAAGRQMGMSGRFAEKVATMGASGNSKTNYERDFMRFARKDLGVNFHIYKVSTIGRCRRRDTRDMEVSMLLPYEVAHLLWEFNPEKFKELWDPERVAQFWKQTIAANEEWFQQHPLRQAILEAPDKRKFLPVTVFGDDGTVGKARAMHTLTWLPATHNVGCGQTLRNC